MITHREFLDLLANVLDAFDIQLIDELDAQFSDVLRISAMQRFEFDFSIFAPSYNPRNSLRLKALVQNL